MLDNEVLPESFGPSHIGKFRRGKYEYIFTTSFDLHRDASNTRIVSICIDKIKYFFWVFISRLLGH